MIRICVGYNLLNFFNINNLFYVKFGIGTLKYVDIYIIIGSRLLIDLLGGLLYIYIYIVHISTRKKK